MKAKLSRASNDKSCPAPSGMAPSLVTQRGAAPTLSVQESFDSLGIKEPASVFGQHCPELPVNDLFCIGVAILLAHHSWP